MKAMRNHRGNTLLEVLVALSVFAVASLGIFAAFKTSLSGWQVTQQFTSEQQSARAVLEWLSRRIRMIGVGYTGVEPVVDYAYANEIRYRVGSECHRIYLLGGVIFHQTGPSTVPCGTTGTSRPLTSDRDAAQLTAQNLLFRYFNAATGGPDDPGVSEMPTPVLGAGRDLIKRVEVEVTINGTQDPVPFTTSTQATIRNGR